MEEIKYPNSRNKYLVINNENVLQNIKFELSAIQNLFSKLLSKLKDIHIKSPENWPYSPYKKMDYLHAEATIYSVMQIPFAILDIINKIFMFNQITIWNKYDEHMLKQLYFTVFSSII